MQSSKLTQSLSFGLDIHTGSGDDLQTGCIEARRIRNEANRLDRAGWDWGDIKSTVVDNADHVNNTTQLIVDKALGEIETYHDNKDDGWGRPYPYIDESYPMVMNHSEGYRLFPEDDGTVRFRITATRGTHVKGELRGNPDHFDRLQIAFNDEEWRVGTAEVVHKHNEWRLHVTVTHETHRVASKNDADTIVGVDVNEDCIALAAMSRNGGVKQSVVFEYPSVKEQRHEFFTKRKRIQKAGQTAFETAVKTEERDYVHDCLHKVSRQVVDWVSQFTDPVIVFEDLKDMRESIDYGTRMNRRLHSLPFATLQEMVSYKAAWEGVSSDVVDPEYTSQRCPRTECQHTDRANRQKKRFKCKRCEFQDHADRKAAVCVVQNWLDEQYGNVLSLETLPHVRTVRRAASGAGGGPDSHGHDLCSGVDRHGTSAQPGMGAREELKSVASAVQD
ncbi:IS1341-type transposase ISNma15 [Natrialba magadii ATCC 43099]|uniref:IS1341-type transposase ISNma15 n=1 Tax=Natrialba magadii (strain ATCC 43099 / DSM 3394 / CCM 3739 / CIP 104546 / IAM 13178 / JCM 8861 / NBRC 102185 / NCIMB 2190 / MS3) TaxID=547559 RepID=D3SR30_NATMM|nr:RNA-guided endonuclease TnpB family protein [Natrialba magadii]ADD06586.1 IS1341-type transposase ISNma15 [Natrialba magadii ATCC 43099]ELY31953.1 transposase, IS605 OrfB family protein [Natrialba magadii ATCC 43099]